MTPDLMADMREVLGRALEHADCYSEYSDFDLTPNAMVRRLFDEIKRLRQSTSEAHGLVIEYDSFGSMAPWCHGCTWNHVYIGEEADPPWELDEWFDTIDDATKAHAAHVEELLNGGGVSE